jgi:ubiquinone/menaquinone biosynthesis C-methylase UbiE
MDAEVDRANRRAWGSRSVAEIFVRREGFVDSTEARMMQRLAREARGQPILDLGVGGGRTTAFLRSVSTDYVGVDYLENLVQAARLRYPGVRFEHSDARDLSAFGGERFTLVVFSLNGIDGLAHADRGAVLAESSRVLRGGGLFAYSTRNLDYRRAAHRPMNADWRTAVRHPVRSVRYALRLPKLNHERRRLGSLTTQGPGWSTVARLAYGAPAIWHQITLGGALAELRDAGFGEVEAYGPAGLAVTFTGEAAADARALSEVSTTEWPSLYLVARKA